MKGATILRFGAALALSLLACGGGGDDATNLQAPPEVPSGETPPTPAGGTAPSGTGCAGFDCPGAPPCTLHVAVDGKDDNPGTNSAPFRTIQTAVEHAGAG